MNTDTLTLDYEGKPLRVAIKDGKPWFAVGDLCRILGTHIRADKARPREAVVGVPKEAVGMHPMQTSRGPRLVLVVSESGLYAVCNGADIVTARGFRDWLVDVALPLTRRAYAAGGMAKRVSPDDIALMRDASFLIERLGARIGAMHAS